MDLYTFALHMFAALIMGAAIGIERQFGRHTAGLRTNALVALGAALYVSISTVLGGDSPTRIAAQVVSGIGFLGGGVILREGFNIRGMNTAATIWCAGAIGTLSGLGFLGPAFIGTLAILAGHWILKPLGRIIDTKTKTEGKDD